MKIEITNMAILSNLTESMPTLVELEVGEIRPCLWKIRTNIRWGFFEDFETMRMYGLTQWYEVPPHKNLTKLKFASGFPISIYAHSPTIVGRLLPVLMTSFPKVSLVTVVKL